MFENVDKRSFVLGFITAVLIPVACVALWSGMLVIMMLVGPGAQ